MQSEGSYQCKRAFRASKIWPRAAASMTARSPRRSKVVAARLAMDTPKNKKRLSQ
jgi:hypothetical protein